MVTDLLCNETIGCSLTPRSEEDVSISTRSGSRGRSPASSSSYPLNPPPASFRRSGEVVGAAEADAIPSSSEERRRDLRRVRWAAATRRRVTDKGRRGRERESGFGAQFAVFNKREQAIFGTGLVHMPSFKILPCSSHVSIKCSTWQIENHIV